MSSAADTSRHHRHRVIAVAVLVLALVLRLPWSAPLTADPALGFAASFGEHALCLAAAGDPASSKEAPGPHADHDAAKCCPSHAAGAVILPGAGSATRIAFETPADRFVAADVSPSARCFGRARARAPPIAPG